MSIFFKFKIKLVKYLIQYPIQMNIDDFLIDWLDQIMSPRFDLAPNHLYKALFDEAGSKRRN